MINLIFEAWAWGLSAGLLGVVYINILSKEETFNFWWRIGAKYEGKKWYFKPLWSCAHCFAGQFALWTYLIARLLPLFSVDAFYIAFTPWHVLRGLYCLIIAVAVAIFTAKVISWHFVKKSI